MDHKWKIGVQHKEDVTLSPPQLIADQKWQSAAPLEVPINGEEVSDGCKVGSLKISLLLPPWSWPRVRFSAMVRAFLTRAFSILEAITPLCSVS